MDSDETFFVGAESQRQAIDLVTNLWQLECRRLLGDLPREACRQQVAALLTGFRTERQCRKFS
jgi:hypothetical protein